MKHINSCAVAHCKEPLPDAKSTPNLSGDQKQETSDFFQSQE